MPTTYAHDLFGKEVYKRLPSDMKALIRRHGDLYRIGLHGPDILFYYMVSKNPVTQFGIEMHHEKARAFFEEGMRQVRRNDDEALFAYLLGFGCHYILDSACHPYVNKMAAEGVIPHIVLEKEFCQRRNPSCSTCYSYGRAAGREWKYAQISSGYCCRCRSPDPDQLL